MIGRVEEMKWITLVFKDVYENKTYTCRLLFSSIDMYNAC